jgi:predicted Zn-dependent protease
MNLATMEYRLGEPAAARRHLEELLARLPDEYAAQSLLAQLELLGGSTERAAALYAQLVRRAPQFGEISNLGTAYLLLGRYAEAEERFRQGLRLQPANPFVALNLADTLLLEGRRREAEVRYRALLDLAGRDPAAAGWQLASVSAQALAHLGRRAPAATEAERVLRLAQGNAQAAYEAALVYAVVGDDASALGNALRALGQGVEARWFALPWFARLREAPELREQLAARGLRAGRGGEAPPGASPASPGAAAPQTRAH